MKFWLGPDRCGDFPRTRGDGPVRCRSICRRPATLVLECVCIFGDTTGTGLRNECDSVQDNRPDIREQSQERASPSYQVSFKQEIVWSPSLKAGSSPTSGLFLLAETGHLHQVKLASLKLVGWLIHSPSRTVFWLLRFPLAVGAVVPFSVWSILPIVGPCEYNSSVWFLRSFPSRLSPPPSFPSRLPPPLLRELSLKQPHSTLYRRWASLYYYRSGREFSIPQLPIHHFPRSCI